MKTSVLGSANELIDSIIAEIETHFRTFGGDRQPTENPISEAMKGKPLVFAAGVDVRDVVEIVAGLTLNHLMEKMKAAQEKEEIGRPDGKREHDL